MRRLAARPVRLALALLLAAQGSFHVWQVAGAGRPEVDDWAVRAQLKWLQGHLDDGAARFDARFFPEGELFTWEFYGLARANLALSTRRPGDTAQAVSELRRLLPRVEASVTRWPFRSMQGWPLKGGVCWFAGQNLLRGRLVQLAGAGATEAEVRRFHRDSQVLAEAFAASATGALEAAPGLSWPVDSVFGLQSLQLHDQLYGTHYLEPALSKWERNQLRNLNAEGLPASQTSLAGRPLDVPRACALSWTLAVLPGLDPPAAKQLWARYRAARFDCRLGFCLVREWPSGQARRADADTGPVVNGYGLSGTAFALGAARANGDAEAMRGLESLGELLGVPVWTPGGKRYLFGAVPMFDVLALWVRTVPAPASTRAAGPSGAALVLALLYAAAVRALVRPREAARASASPSRGLRPATR